MSINLYDLANSNEFHCKIIHKWSFFFLGFSKTEFWTIYAIRSGEKRLLKDTLALSTFSKQNERQCLDCNKNYLTRQFQFMMRIDSVKN